ncbi:hypothetical protein RAZWK3B_17108 [Roseobacter sp. AzwK-3b]|nr:hypothetical protein RAZWK3B_17108 [Roseobacter sp. AzwK-3b]
MIAAKEDRQVICGDGFYCVCNGLRPRLRLVRGVDMGRHVAGFSDRPRGEVTKVGDMVAEACQGIVQTGDAEGVGAHEAALAAFAAIHRGADQNAVSRHGTENPI